jgi:hypothetical protein
VLAALAGACSTASAVWAAPAPARVQVTADEFRLGLSRASIPAGAAVVELLNLGEDDHDLAMRRLGAGAVTRRTAIVEPGRLGEISARLRPGRYRLWCTLPGHRALGMAASLVVRPR